MEHEEFICFGICLHVDCLNGVGFCRQSIQWNPLKRHNLKKKTSSLRVGLNFFNEYQLMKVLSRADSQALHMVPNFASRLSPKAADSLISTSYSLR